MNDDRQNLQASPSEARRRVRFGPYEADFHTQELRKHGMRLKLSGQPLQVLEMLLARPGELVTREQLQKRLWSDNTFADFNHGLNAAVNKLRDTLSDSADNPRYIETLPRRGYRFIGEIESAAALETNIAAETTATAEAPASVTAPPAGSVGASVEAVPCAPSLAPKSWTRRAKAGAACVMLLTGFGVIVAVNSALHFERQFEAGRVAEPQGAMDPAQAPVPVKMTAEIRRPAMVARNNSGLAEPAVNREPGTLQTVPTMRTVISGEGGAAGPQFSPDGRRIAFMSNRTGPWQIWVSDLDGANARQVSFTGSAGTPRWSPDGQTIAFDAPSDEGTSIYVARADGRGHERRLVEGLVPSFSRDGKWVYFASDRTGDWQVWKAPVEGGGPVQVTRRGGFAALESPDGYLYYSKSRYPNPAICRMRVAGGEEACTLPHLRPRTWSSWAVTRNGILFVEDLPGGRPTLSLYEPTKRQVRDLVSLQSAPFWMGATSDGKRALINDAEERQISMVEGLR